MVFFSFLLVNFRDRVVFFLNILLPIVFLLLFGALFGKGGGNRPRVAFYSDRDLQPLNEQWKKLEKPPNVDEVGTLDFDLVVVASDGKIDVFVKNAFATQTGEVELFKLRYASAGVGKKVVRVEERVLHVGRTLSELEYLIVGVLAISFLSVGMNAGARIFSDYVQYGLFRRFNVTPISPLRLTTEITGAQVLTGFISSLLLILASRIFFRVSLFVGITDIPKFAAAVLAAVLINFALGVFLALAFKRAATMVSQVLYTIFVFFSGVYFPITFLPGFLRVASYFTTARYVHLLFQKVYDVNVVSDLAFWTLCAVFVGTGVVSASVATKRFLRLQP